MLIAKILFVPLSIAGMLRPPELPAPFKSSCFLSAAMMPDEVRSRLRSIDSLWHSPVKGKMGAQAWRNSTTAFIRPEAVLPEAEIDPNEASATADLIGFQRAAAPSPLADRVSMKDWLVALPRA